MLSQFPKPTGQYSVGSKLYHWTDNNLEDKYKAFNVEVFYPSSNPKDSNKKFLYQPEKIDALKYIMSQQVSIPIFIWNRLLSGIYTFTEPNAPVASAQSKFPVIIHLPGIGSDNLYNVYLEELASYGYVIFAIEPPHDLLVTVFPGSKVIGIDPVLKKAADDVNRGEIYKYRYSAHVRWNGYINFALNKVRELNEDKNSMFYNKLDWGTIGLLGHSHGGAVVTDFCQKNKICKAGINMDGWTKTYNTGKYFDAPFLLLLSESGGMPEMQELLENNNRADFKKLVIPGAGHSAFSDHILIKPLAARIFGDSSANSVELRKEISHNIVTFFNKYLKDA